MHSPDTLVSFILHCHVFLDAFSSYICVASLHCNVWVNSFSGYICVAVLHCHVSVGAFSGYICVSVLHFHVSVVEPAQCGGNANASKMIDS